MNVESSIQEMQKAIEIEIRASSTDSSKFIDVSKGRMLAETDEGFLYSFSADVQVLVPPETPVAFKRPGSNRVSGIWIGQDGFEILLTLKERLGPNVERGQLVVDLTFILSELSKRLSEIESAPGRNLIQLILSGRGQKIADSEFQVAESIRKLRQEGQLINDKQALSINNCAAQAIEYVWGPPGTGKTANLSHVCRAICEQGERILVVAHANAAVDVAMLRIAESMADHNVLAHGKILRIGFSQSPEVRHHNFLSVMGIIRRTEPEFLDQWDYLEEQKKDLQAKLKDASPAEARQLEPLLNATRKQLELMRARLRELEAKLIEGSLIVGCTAAKAVIDQRLWQRKVDTVVIDEVSMMNFPFVAAMASRASKRVLQFGDFMQLPPIVVSDDEIAKKWMSQDSFQISGVTRSIENEVPDQRITMLEEQYRMQSQICNVVSLLSYGQRLVTADGVDERVNSLANANPHPGAPMFLADTSKFRSVCIRESKPGRYSRANPLHAIISLNIAHNLVSEGITDCCVITPYRAQARLINGIASELEMNISVATVHRFQGAERAAVIFDVCDAFPQPRASRLTGHDAELALRLINVGISRAKGKLIVVADRNFISEYHDGRSPTRKACAYLAQFGVARDLELDDVDLCKSPFEWFDDFSSAQSALAHEIVGSIKAFVNLPEGFNPASQVTRALESVRAETESTGVKLGANRKVGDGLTNLGSDVRSGGFYCLLDRCVFVGGRDPDSPVALVHGNVAGHLSRVYFGDDQDERIRPSLPGLK